MSQPRLDSTLALFASHVLLPTGWARDVLLVWDAAGTLTGVTPIAGGIVGVHSAPGIVVPGMPNLHSHAFQRVFAGLTEYRGGGGDNFWSWRETMYRFAAVVEPNTLEDIATHLYVEMLRAGYTSVCEFHYLHHDAEGQPYADMAEMALSIVAAAERAGIGLTLLPVLYQSSGFGASPPHPQQRRFVNSVDDLLHIVDRLRASGVRLGAAPHSLRAVSAAALRHLLDGVQGPDPSAPVHIHIAEQRREVEECLALNGRRPVQWLLDQAAVDHRWCLVHATHIDDAERLALAASGATVGLCPSTEANLGDGVFPAAAYVDAGGAWGIGSDSHAGIDPAGELRLLEYMQRSTLERRNVLACAETPFTAQRMWQSSVAGGARASGRNIAGLAVGQRADFVVLSDAGAMQGLTPDQMLASHLFAPRAGPPPREVWVGGRCRISEGRHVLDEAALQRFVNARAQLLNEG